MPKIAHGRPIHDGVSNGPNPVMPAHNGLLFSGFLKIFARSSEADGVDCSRCHCFLGPNDWDFASARHQDDKDHVVCFYKEFKEKDVRLSPYPPSADYSFKLPCNRVLTFLKVKDDDNKNRYYCLTCFRKTNFGHRDERIRNQAKFLCTQYQIGLVELSGLDRIECDVAPKSASNGSMKIR